MLVGDGELTRDKFARYLIMSAQYFALINLNLKLRSVVLNPSFSLLLILLVTRLMCSSAKSHRRDYDIGDDGEIPEH